jgi:FixJ family two-component response regulator
MHPIVYVVDDDPDVLKALTRALRAAGHHVVPSISGEELVELFRADGPGCLVLDLSLRTQSGTDIQAELAQRGFAPPIVYVSGAADIASAVAIMKRGAVDLLTKPVDLDELIEAVLKALDRDARAREKARKHDVATKRLLVLTAREAEVLHHVLDGRSNLFIANVFDITLKTVKAHREHLRSKLGVRSVAEMAYLAIEGEFSSMATPPRDCRCGRRRARN